MKSSSWLWRRTSRFLRPERFLVEFVQGCGLVVVARRRHGVDVEFMGWPGLFERFYDLVRLHACEKGSARADAEGLLC